MPILLGGSASPLGWWVTFLEASVERVGPALASWFGARLVGVHDAGPYPACLERLDPLEAPWSRLLAIEAGAWTALVDNSLLGGDPTAPGPALGQWLDVRCVAAGHSPRHGPGHETTALWIWGADGAAPSREVRTVQVACADGQWSWFESGVALPFEKTARYGARRKRDRFDRELLLEYLAAFEIYPDEPGWLGESRLVASDRAAARSVPRRVLRAELGLDGSG